MSAAGTLRAPGQLLGETSEYHLGHGVHIHGSQLFASISGPLVAATPSPKSRHSTASIMRISGPLLPEVGTIVLGKITRTNPRQATIAILALGDTGAHVLREPFPGIIRQQDIRATEIDKVKVNESFRVGDIVRAVIISLGDERSYFLSTAKNELGVVMAVNEWGNRMVPVSWKEFMDMDSGMKELRKVAKPL